MKFGFDIATYALSAINGGIVAGTQELMLRRQFDLGIQYAQLIPRLKDLVQIIYWRVTGAEMPRIERSWLALAFETSVGVIATGFIIASTRMQDLEAPGRMRREDVQKLLGLKATFNLSNALAQILSAPKTYLNWETPKEALWKLRLIGVRSGLLAGVLPAFTWAKVGVSDQLGLQFTDN